jgi:uncharacterized protein (DUF1697 family)
VPTHIALLRGINVGGRNRVAMADLREVFTGLGHTEVGTYIQSGNVVFTSTDDDPGALAGACESAIVETLGVHPTVVVLTREELARTVTGNPYPDEANPKALHAVFGREPFGPAALEVVAAAVAAAEATGSGEHAQLVGDTLYLHTPGGLGRSALAAQLARARGPLAPDAASTARNWATVGKLLAMCRA